MVGNLRKHGLATAVLVAGSMVLSLWTAAQGSIQVDQPFAITGGAGETATDEQPRVCLGGGKYLSVHVTWTTDSGGAPNGDIYGAFMDPAAGTLQTMPVYLSSAWESSCTNPAVAYDPDNSRYLVVFEDQWLTYYSDIYMVLLDGEGNELAQGFVTSDGEVPTEEVMPDVAYAGNGTFVVVWCQKPDPLSAGQSLVLANTVTYDGTGVWTGANTYVVSQSATFDASGATRPRITAGKDGQSLVVWQWPVDKTNPDPATWTYDIHGRLLGPDAQPLGQVCPIAGTVRDEGAPSATYNAYDDLFVIVWQDLVAASNHNILAGLAHADAGGALTVDSVLSIAQPSRDDTQPVVSWNQNQHKFLVAWQTRISANNHDLYARQLDPDGTTGNTFAISRSSTMQRCPAIARGLDTFALVWEDQAMGVGDADVFGTFISDTAPSPHITAVTPSLATEHTKTMPLDTVTITFDRDVQISAADITVVGRRIGPCNGFAFAYDAGTATVTLTWPTPLANDAYVLTVTDTVQSTRDEPLDGDTSLTSPLLPSGNGTPGGDFVGLIYRLIGDTNGDGFVNVGDLQMLVMTWGTTNGLPGYNEETDLNADGFVNVGDLQALVANWGQSIQKGS